MDIPMSQSPGRKAALATSHAKRGFVMACILFVGAYYFSRAQREAPPAPAAPAASVQDVLARVAVSYGGTGTVNVHNIFYNKDDGVTCGEVNGQTGNGADMKLKDGIRIFVCGPTLPDKARH